MEHIYVLQQDIQLDVWSPRRCADLRFIQRSSSAWAEHELYIIGPTEKSQL